MRISTQNERMKSDELNLQVIVATMNQQDHSLLDTMNIESDAIICNQCDRNEIEEFTYKQHEIKYLSFNERGVGLNRNNGLMRAHADICFLADDDIVFNNNYKATVIESFVKNPEADLIIFNLEESKPTRFIIKRKMKIGYLNYMRFGAVRIAFKRKSVTRNGISFNLHFGGGAEYSGGEDTLFLTSCLNKGLKIIALPTTIGSMKESRASTWFTGYNEKYLKDRGALFAAVSRRWSWILALQFVLRRNRLFRDKINVFRAMKLLKEGIRSFEGKN